MPLIWDYLNNIVVVPLSWIINHFLNWSESRTKRNTGIWRSVEILFVIAQHTCIGCNESSSRYNFFSKYFSFQGYLHPTLECFNSGKLTKKKWFPDLQGLLYCQQNICCKNRSLCEVMLLNNKMKDFQLIYCFPYWIHGETS